MPTLLSPAGNIEKMKAAINFGADAVYLAGKAFGMRAAAGNFTEEEMAEAIAYAHDRGVSVNVTVNVMPRSGEYEALGRYLSFLESLKPDALIVSDLGVIELAKQKAPSIPLHLSTQASVVSAETAKAYHALGVKRIVLARELSMEEVKAIRRDTPKSLEIETFIHGAMCVSYSGRCLLSNNLAARDGNRGQCAQPCRWEYRFAYIEEKMRQGQLIPVEEDAFGTYIMSSKDMCMIEHIPELMESGIDCFKIEGRMKSVCYVSAVTNAYRMAMDAYRKQGSDYRFDPLWKRELESVSHREYGTGYYYGEPSQNANLCSGLPLISETAYIATALADSDENGTALFEQKNKSFLGETLELLTPGQTGRAFAVEHLWDEEGSVIDSTPHPLMRYRMALPFAVKKGDIIRRAAE